MRPLRDESGFTLMELMVVLTITLVIVAALANLFSSGMTATSKANAALASQANLIVAVNRLEFEARCASAAKLVSGGAGRDVHAADLLRERRQGRTPGA